MWPVGGVGIVLCGGGGIVGVGFGFGVFFGFGHFRFFYFKIDIFPVLTIEKKMGMELCCQNGI